MSGARAMIRFHKKAIDVVREASDGATTGLICTPYYSERGLKLLDPFFDATDEVEFWTRFSPLDWRAGVADMAALSRRIQSVVGREKRFVLWVSDDLHAKIYRFSDDKVIIGSANLTWPGMTSNVEVVCELTESEAADLSSFLSNFRDRLTLMETGVFTAYVDVVADAISKPFDGLVEENEEMNAAIDLAEEELRKALRETAHDATGIPPAELEEFIDYCRRENTEVCQEIIARHEGKHNLQGHVKHCFYGCARFLSEFQEFITEIAATPGDSLYDFASSSVRTSWRNFLRDHANEIDKERGFSFHTLRVYVPATLGGKCTGGGGGSPTLKRVLPVVARMLQSL